MATYTVQPNQNIFDISLQLYGTVEGIFDLLITNKWLNMNTDLATGQELEYHEDFVINESIVSNLASDNVVPSNGERHVYYKRPSVPLLVICDIDADAPLTSFVIGGEGEMLVDWGDNSELENVQLSHTTKTITHYFDNTVEKRRLKFYGDPSSMKLTYWDTTELGGVLIVLQPIVVDEYVSHSNGCDLTGLFLFEGTYRVDLLKCDIDNLLPIGNMELQELNLSKVRFADVSVIDKYLEYIVANYGTRRGCTVYLDTKPSAAGIAAINAILGEEEWNTPIPWKFIINDETYTYSA